MFCFLFFFLQVIVNLHILYLNMVHLGSVIWRSQRRLPALLSTASGSPWPEVCHTVKHLLSWWLSFPKSWLVQRSQNLPPDTSERSPVDICSCNCHTIRSKNLNNTSKSGHYVSMKFRYVLPSICKFISFASPYTIY